jgi:arylsulfatase
MPAAPNVILICVDQWRGDCLSIDKHPVVHTPFLDHLALQGTRFSHAYTSSPSCIASRAALFTGLSQRNHGRVGYQDGVRWNYPTTLAGEFTRHGYQTQAVGKMHVHPARSQQGFQNVTLFDGFLHYNRHRGQPADANDDYLPWLREKAGHTADYFDHGVNCNSLVARPWDKEESLHPTNWVVSQSVEFLRRRDTDKPFFLFMSFFHPHPPYVPPAWALEQYLSSQMPDPPVGDWEESFLARYMDSDNPMCSVGKVRPDVLHRARAGYYGHMSHIDQQIHRFIELLREYKQQDNTWICFVSDHGEHIGDHHLYRKSLGYEGSARVPLILKGPPDAGLAKGARLDPVVELRDIMPTLLDCAGLPIPDSLDGRSFLPFAKNAAPASWRPYIHGEHVIFGNQSQHWLTDGKEKYLWYSGLNHEQLFDLTRDPNELHDLAPSTPDRLAFWRQRLITELTGREEGYTDGKTLIPNRPPRATLSQILSKPTQPRL